MHTCMCVGVCVCVCMCIFMYIYTYICGEDLEIFKKTPKSFQRDMYQSKKTCFNQKRPKEIIIDVQKKPARERHVPHDSQHMPHDLRFM